MSSSRLIQASAGTGKTYALSGQFISLLLAGEDCGSILASTFTRKAAGEILERIYLRLARSVLDNKSRAELAAQANLPSLSATQVQAALLSLIENQNQLKVSTLDSFASSIARLFTEELGLPSNWSVQDQPSASLQISLAVAAVCSSLESDKIASLVTTLKRGESSRSISNAIGNIVGGLLGVFQETNFSAWNWLQVAKPAPELKIKLIESLKLCDLPKTQAGKVNQKVYSGFQKLISLLDQEQWSESLKGTLLQNAAKGSNLYNKATFAEDVFEVLKEVAKMASAHELSKLGDANRAAYALLLGVIHELEAAENASGKISFDRIIRRLVQLGNSLFSDELYFRLDTKIHHVLLDEFQDTSLLQWQFLKPLIEEKLSAAEINSSFFCVGDSKQAIYGWRDGNTAIFDSIPKRWEQIKVSTLETSYRSKPAIIDAVNSVFSSLQENDALEDFNPAVTKWLSRFNKHSTTIIDLDAKLSPTTGVQSFVSFEAINAQPDSEIYYSFLFEKLRSITEKNPEAEVGILVRSNKSISTILDLAESYNFELSAQGGTPLTRFPLITALLAMLALVDNPGDRIKQFEVKASPWCQDQNLDSFIESLKANLISFGLVQTLQLTCKPYLGLFSLSEHKALEQLLYLAIKEELSAPLLNLQSFIRIVEGSAVEELRNTRVQVLTIHKSKGLEFDVVVIPDLSFDLEASDKHDYLLKRDPLTLAPLRVSLPGTQDLRIFSEALSEMATQERLENFEESLSLLYVALTRAKSQLHLMTDQSALTAKSITAAKVIAHKIPAKEIALIEPCADILKESYAWPEQQVIDGDIFKKFLPEKSARKLRGLGRTSPTSFNLQNYHDSGIEDPAAQMFGTLIHKLFALTPWLEDCLDAAELEQQLCRSGADRKQAKTALDKFFSYLKLGEVAAVMRKPDEQSAKAYREKSFIFRDGNALMQGRIDRLVINKEQGHIIDFKVGKKPDDNLSPKTLSYMEQLKTYKKAAMLLFPSVEFEAALLFLGDGTKLPLSALSLSAYQDNLK